jgi:predicted esterase
MKPSTLDLGFVHRFEPGTGSKLTLLLLHGTGGNEDDLIPLGRDLAPDASLLSPRGRVLEEGMPRFFRRLAEGVFDVKDLKSRSKELAEFIRDAATEYKFDIRSMVFVGYSNGANIAAGMLLMGSLLPAGAILFRPMVPFVLDRSPNMQGIPVFISAGRFDRIVPRGETERLARMLVDAGAEVEVNWESSTHALSKQERTKAANWLIRNFSS